MTSWFQDRDGNWCSGAYPPARYDDVPMDLSKLKAIIKRLVKKGGRK